MDRTNSPECLEGRTHVWVFPTGDGREIQGRSSRKNGKREFTKYATIVVEKQNKAVCSVCNKKYTFKYDLPEDMKEKKKYSGQALSWKDRKNIKKKTKSDEK